MCQLARLGAKGLKYNYDPEDPRSWKTICLSCNVSRVLVHFLFFSFFLHRHIHVYPHLFSLFGCFNIFKLWDHCNWLAAVVVFLPNLAFSIHVLIPLFFCIMYNAGADLEGGQGGRGPPFQFVRDFFLVKIYNNFIIL